MEQRFSLEVTLKDGWKIDPETLTEYIMRMDLLFKSVDSCHEFPQPTKTDIWYDEHKTELEAKYMGKFIAIDKDMKVVGVGNAISEAYDEAIKVSDQKQFNFRSVGFIPRI